MRNLFLLWITLCIAIFSKSALSEIYKCEINGKIELTDNKLACNSPKEVIIGPENIVHAEHGGAAALPEIAEENTDIKALEKLDGFRSFVVDGRAEKESFFQIKNDGKSIYLLSKDRVVRFNKVVGRQRNLYIREPTSGFYFSGLSSIDNGIYAIRKKSIGNAAVNSGIYFFNSKDEIVPVYEEKPKEIYAENDVVWIGGSNYVGWIDVNSKQVYKHDSGYVWGLQDDGEYVWFGARDKYDKEARTWKKIGGVYFADKRTKKFVRLDDSLLLGSDIFGLHVEGKYLWASHGSLGSGLTRYDLEAKESKFLSFSINGIGLGGYNFASDEKYIWMAGYESIVRLDKNTLVAEEYSCHLQNKCRVLDILHDGERLWLALGENGVATIQVSSE